MYNASITENLQWKQFVSGDEASFTELFKHFSKPLFNYGSKIVGDEELIKECLQELFLTLWKSRTRLSVNVVSVQSYLFLSFKRMLLRKSKQAAKIISFNRKAYESFSIEYSIEQIIIEKETVTEQEKLLASALHQLTDRQKEAIYLKFYHNMSYEEIGEIMSINYQSLRSLVYKGIKLMHTHLVESTSESSNGISLRSFLSLLF
jgi:RNA polymerase sigma factor (sigma-70 family)